MEVATKPAANTSAVDEKGTPPKAPVKKDASNAENGHEKATPVQTPNPKESGDKTAITDETSSELRQPEVARGEEGEDGDNKLTFDGIKAAVDEIDDNLDDALGHAADSIWSFATSVTGTVTSVVKEGPPDFENLRKNVTSRLAPLDHIGRDLTSHIGAFAPNEAAIANITGSVKSVAQSVQRNAQAMEAAILAKANRTESSEASRGIAGSGASLGDVGASELAIGDPAMGVLPLMSVKADDDPEDVINVNDEIAKVGETISNSFVAQTVGDLWTGLWGSGAGDHHENGVDGTTDMPKTRFEKRIVELQANPDTYCEPAKDLDAFEEWSKTFNLDDNADSCIAILDRHESIAELYERVVPRIVDEDTFWMRYFFARHVLEKEEERRKRLLERAENAVAEGNDDDDGWGDDDWDDDTHVQTENKSVDEKSAVVAEGDEAVAAGIPSFPENEDGRDWETVSGEEVTGRFDKGKKITVSRKGADGTAASNPVTGFEGIPASEDDWGDDDWE